MTDTSKPKILQIVCGKCKLLCAVPPVSEESGYYYCGRCRPEAEPNLLFEDAAKKVIFPCRFGCGNQLAWGQVLKHEIVCKKRTIICPSVNCQQLVTHLSMLPDHIKAQHPSIYQQSHQINQLELGSLDFMIRLHCIRYEKYTFLFFIKFEHNPEEVLYYFNFSICLVWPQDFDQTELDNLKCRLNIDVPAANINITKLIHGKDIRMYQDRKHCLSCLYQTCDKALHENKFDWLSERVAVVIKSSDRDIFYSIEAYKQERIVDIAPDDLECPVCMKYMTEQIFVCVNGHSLCNKCKSSQSNQLCPVCRSTIGITRNYALEKLIKSMKIACRRSTSGCMFAGTVAAVRTHEKSCK